MGALHEASVQKGGGIQLTVTPQGGQFTAPTEWSKVGGPACTLTPIDGGLSCILGGLNTVGDLSIHAKCQADLPGQEDSEEEFTQEFLVHVVGDPVVPAIEVEGSSSLLSPV